MKRPLRRYIRECGTRNKEQGCTAVYSVTNSQGFVPSTDYFSKEVYSKDLSNYKIVKRGMIAYNPSRVNVGSLAVQNAEEQVIVSPLYVVFSVDETQLLPDYICYFLHSDLGMKEIAAHTSGSVRDSLKFSALQNIEITIRPVVEQEEIITLLRKIESIIEKRNRTLKKIDDLVKSQFIEMFGGYSLRNKQPGWVKVGAVAEVVGGSTPKTDKPEYWDGDFYWITPAEIKEDDFIVTHTQRSLTEKGVSSCSLRRLPVGTVLLSSRAPIGKVAIAGVEMYCNQGFKNLICGEELNSVYVYALLKYNSDYLNLLGRGATFKEISKSIVENICIPVPAIARQNEFARFVEQTDKSFAFFRIVKSQYEENFRIAEQTMPTKDKKFSFVFRQPEQRSEKKDAVKGAGALPEKILHKNKNETTFMVVSIISAIIFPLDGSGFFR